MPRQAAVEKRLYAIISDLHSNIEALNAVLADMAGYSVDKILCLGDVVGYGPSPTEVLRIVKRCEFILLGNHEEGLLFEDASSDFNPRARRALHWTRDQINSCPKAEMFEFWEMFGAMEKNRAVRTDDAIFVHGSLRNETRDYVLPSDIHDKKKMLEIFTKMDRSVCFFGHTHIPGVWSESGKFVRPDQFGHTFVVPKEKVVINVGSVGQPRDGDNRACYVLVDDDKVIFRRVPYDFESTMKKIFAIEELDDMLAERLRVGR